MNRREVINLAEWIYDAKPTLRAYADKDLAIQLLAASLMHRIRNWNKDLHRECEDDFWETVNHGPNEGGY